MLVSDPVWETPSLSRGTLAVRASGLKTPRVRLCLLLPRRSGRRQEIVWALVGRPDSGSPPDPLSSLCSTSPPSAPHPRSYVRLLTHRGLRVTCARPALSASPLARRLGAASAAAATPALSAPPPPLPPPPPQAETATPR